jgi:hypothetical protein
MRDRNSRCRRMVTFLGLLLAFSAMACNGGPTSPTFDELPRIYTGRWRGTINGFEVVLDVRATPGDSARWIPVGLDGEGTALNSATGESHRLTVSGHTAGENSTMFLLSIAYVLGPGGVILSGGQVTGNFHGAALPDRTWPGHWTSATGIYTAPIFGPGEYSVTLIKE